MFGVNMKILSKIEGADWIGKLDRDNSWKQKYGDVFSSFAIPADTGKKTGLAKLLADVAGGGSECLVWITGYGVWPSSENMALFDGYRKSLGENRSVDEAPVHVFSNKDLKELESITALALYFFWDALLLDQSQGILIEISHDEIMDVRATNKDLFERVEANLTRYGLEQVSRSVK
jgi:hypothetical protein